MRALFIFLFFLTFVNFTSAQTLHGKYQLATKLVTSSYHDYYEFSDSLFSFVPTSYDGLNTIHSINGTYKVLNKKIYFYVTSLKMYNVIGIERDPTYSNQNSWSVTVDEVNLYKIIPVRKKYYIEFQMIIANGLINSIKIGNDIYYKVEE